jgi:negative regulator of flagellin synthesis FlgM
MMQIHGPSHIHGAQPIHGPSAARPAQPPSTANAAPTVDRLDISEAGQIAGQLSGVPDIRTERVADVRAAILNGTYETADKLSTAVERLLDEIA